MRLRFILLLTLLLSSANAFAYRTAAWIPPWDAAALTSIQLHAGDLDESNPVWYSLSPGGAIVANWNAENPTWLAAMTGTRILPTIQNTVNGSFDGSVAASLLSTPTSREAHAQAIADLVLGKVYDGIDVDYERVPAASRANFTAFIQLLGQKLHASGKQLSVTVYAKTSDAQNWDGPGAEDWPALGAAADWIKIMAYDYHWSTSAPGAITPLSWLDQVAAYAESAIPAAKVVVGLPWYGYDWTGSSGAGVVYSTAMSTASANGATIARDANNEATYTYAGHTVYFQDAAAYKSKTDLLRQKHPAIAGVAHWRSGNEDPEFWTVIESLRGTTAPPPPTVAPDFSVSGPASITLRTGKSASATESIARVGGFTGAVTVTAEKLAAFDGTLSLSQMTLSGTTSSTDLRVAAGRNAAAGTYAVRVRFTSGTLVHDAIVNVTVTKK
jgi:spore germination protein YaaH